MGSFLMFDRLAHNKTALFWTLHTTGWLGYALLNYLQGIAFDKAPDYIVPSLIYGAGGFVLTLGLREVFRAVWTRHPLTIAIVGGLAAGLAAALFGGFRSWVFLKLYENYWTPESWTDYFNDLALPFYVIVAWSGLYFGIKYYRMSQRQNEQVLKATSAAHQAQLKMLRYQLNPHFLFNTLNAISTLVLEGETETANRMVTRLSQFLRYSLDRDPMQTVSLKKELDALNLYLTIEKIRFEERLQVSFDIQPEAERALVPSMILQPLIENAIKYAIAVSEDGGTIDIQARVERGRLCLTVADDGPGIPDLDVAMPRGKNGVGLANTRERLSVLYGARQEFRMSNCEPNGLAVTICIPFERSER